MQTEGAKDRTVDIRDLRQDAPTWQILQERAQALATHQVDTLVEQGEEVLIFRLGNDSYSLPAHYIREVQPLVNWTPLPATPSFVIGLVNVRGKILAALDVRPLLDIAQGPPRADALLIILQIQSVEVGLLADSVVEVRRDHATVTQTLAAVAGRSIPWIRGLDQSLALLLDPPQFIADPRVTVQAEVG